MPKSPKKHKVSKGQNKGIHRKPLSPFAPAKRVIQGALDRAVATADKVAATLDVDAASTRLLPNKGFHRDYRVVIAAVLDNALRNTAKLTYLQRAEFENLGESDQFKRPENPIACLIRALGRYETAFFERNNQVLSTDAFESVQWLNIWRNVRVLLSTTAIGNIPGAVLWEVMEAVAKNAGFSSSDYT